MPIKIARPLIPMALDNLVGQLYYNYIPTSSWYNVLELGSLSPTRDLTTSQTLRWVIEICKSDKLFGEVTNIGMNLKLQSVI